MKAIAEIIKAQFGSDDVARVVSEKSTKQQERVFVSKATKRVTVSSEEAQKLFKAANIEYTAGMENRILERVLTDESVDRYGDIVQARGGDFTDFKKNPVLLAFHNSRTFPIGDVIKIWREGTAIKGWLWFMDDTMDKTGVADTAFRMAAAGVLKGGSIGFMPKEYEEPDEKKRAKLEMGKWGVIFTKWELIEFSVCPVPANPNALSFGDIRTKDIFSMEAAKKVLDIYSEETARAITDILEGEKYGEYVKIGDYFEFVNEELNEKASEAEHVVRLRSPSVFEVDSFRSILGGTIVNDKEAPADVTTFSGGSGESRTVQALRFPVSEWTEEKTLAWLKDNEISYIKFVPASKDSEGSEMTVCSSCRKGLVYNKYPEVAMGAIECPNCKAIINQVGKVVSQEGAVLDVVLSQDSIDSITTLTNQVTLLVDKLDVLADSLKERTKDSGLSSNSSDLLYGEILESEKDLRASVASIGFPRAKGE